MTSPPWSSLAALAGGAVLFGLLAWRWWIGRLPVAGLTRRTGTGAPLPWFALGAAGLVLASVLAGFSWAPLAVLGGVLGLVSGALLLLGLALFVYAPDRFLPRWARPFTGPDVKLAFADAGTPVAEIVATLWGGGGRRGDVETDVLLTDPQIPQPSVQGQPTRPAGPRPGRLFVRKDGAFFAERSAPDGPLALALWLPRRDLLTVGPVQGTVRFTTGSWPVPVDFTIEGTSDPERARELAAQVARRIRVELSPAGP